MLSVLRSHGAVSAEAPVIQPERPLPRLLAAAATALVAIFILPWFIPWGQPANSLSYTYGYNNTAAWLAVVLLLAALCWLRLAKTSAFHTGALDARLAAVLDDAGGRGTAALRVAFAATAITGVLLQVLCYRLIPSNDFGEIGQHTARLDLMLLGLRPHTDFHYIFGPAMLYAAYGLYRLGFGAISIDTAYCAALCAYWALGTALLFYVVRSLSGTVNKVVVFVGVTLVYLNPAMMGMQYTPLRYLLPLAGLFCVHRLVTGSQPRLVAVMALGSLFAFVALAFSPDAGVQTAGALFVYFASLLRTPLRRFALGSPVVALTAAVALTVFGRDYLDSIRSHSSAVSAFPFYPSLTGVAFLALVFTLLPALVSISLRRRTPAGSLTLGLAAALGLAIPPALGRCDAMHIAWNSAGLLLVALAVATTLSRAWLARAALAAYFVVFPLSSLVAMSWHSYGDLALRFLRGGAPPAAPAPGGGESLNIVSPYLKSSHFAADLEGLLRYQKLGIPFGASEDVRRFLKLTGRFIPEYWPETASYLGNEADIARKLRDLSNMDTIMIPREIYLVDNFMTITLAPGLEPPRAISPAEHRATAAYVLQTVTLFPAWLPPARNAPLLPDLRVAREIARRYRLHGEFRHYLIAVKADH